MTTPVKQKILLVEDDMNFGIILRDYLMLNGYDVTLARNGMEGFEKFKKDNYDLIILDVMMPYKDGFTLAKEIRQRDQKVPLIFLTAKTMKEDMLKGYKIGADDYINKPFDSEVLIYKIKALLNRSAKEKEKERKALNDFQIGDFTFDAKLRSLKFRNEEPVKLSPKESKLLQLLATYKNDLMPREKALTEIWQDDNYFTSRSMDVYIAKLRKLLKKDPNVKIVNIHGAGFRLVDPSEVKKMMK